MSAESDKIRNAFADQLASFDDKLQSTTDDVDMLTDIREGIGDLLASDGASEAEVRRVLQERYESGALRKETFQLVKSMLDHYVTERVPTSPTGTTADARDPDPKPPPQPDPVEDSFAATTVIPSDVLPINDADARVQIGSILRDRFLLQQKISGGSMGVVYKALDRRLAEAGSDSHNVAIKILSPTLAENGNALRALQQEAAKTRCLVHPNIVRFIDLDRDDELYFLILEWLEGRTLADILDSADARSIDKEAAFRIVRQVGDALDYAHRCGIVHADVKPGNIMIMPNGDAKLFDFGVARVRQTHPDSDFDPGVLGALTPAYSSMQVLGGEEPAAADDVFSLGCLLYRLVAGYRVFGPRNATEASQSGMTPQRPHGLGDGQWSALKKALSYARVTRFASVREFLDALEDDHSATVTIEKPERFVTDDGGSPGKWIAIIVVALGLGAIAAQQLGYLDQWLGDLRGDEPFVEVAAPAIETVVVDAPPATPSGTEAAGEDTVEPASATPLETIEAVEVPVSEIEPEVVYENLVDFSQLPPPSATVTFNTVGGAPELTPVVLREDGDPLIVDFVREGDLARPITLRLEEVGFSGNVSPWASGQYALSNAGLLSFPAGQATARITLTAASDPRREPDQQSILRLRYADAAETELAILQVTLQDDDQRVFEKTMPTNTVAFASNQVSVSEADPAVQIDIVRFNPDNSSLIVGFSIEDLTATEGEDYFAPSSYSISFGPGQRSARLLVPLVQDSRAEGDEAFLVRLAIDPDKLPANVSPNVAVMIRDDE